MREPSLLVLVHKVVPSTVRREAFGVQKRTLPLTVWLARVIVDLTVAEIRHLQEKDVRSDSSTTYTQRERGCMADAVQVSEQGKFNLEPLLVVPDGGWRHRNGITAFGGRALREKGKCRPD